MNLHFLASGMVGTVNPPISVGVLVNTGNSTAPDGSRAPSFATLVTVTAQVQELSTKDLQQTEGLNLTGTSRTLYTNGQVNAGMRISLKGGDVIVIPDGTPGIGLPGATLWLVVAVPEAWPDWCKAIIVLQNSALALQIGANPDAEAINFLPFIPGLN